MTDKIIRRLHLKSATGKILHTICETTDFLPAKIIAAEERLNRVYSPDEAPWEVIDYDDVVVW